MKYLFISVIIIFDIGILYLLFFGLKLLLDNIPSLEWYSIPTAILWIVIALLLMRIPWVFIE